MLKKHLDCWKSLPRRKKIIWLVSPVIAFIIILSILLLRNPAPKLEFNPYNSNQGGFSVQVPGGMMEMSSARTTIFGRQVIEFIHAADTLQYGFRVKHFDLPAGFITPVEKNNMFTQLIQDYVTPVKGVISDSVAHDIDGNQGIKFSVEWVMDDQEYSARVLMLMVSNRVFVVSAFGVREEIRKHYILNFPGSFELKI